MRTMIITLLMTVTAAGCGQAGTAGSTVERTAASGLSGVVRAAPTCPAESISNPCPPKPVKIELQIRTAGTHRVVKTVTSDGQGRFQVSLPPGRYTVDPVSQHSYLRA